MMKTLLLLGMYFFCHIKIRKAVLNNEPLVEIPPEIYVRMLFSSQILNQVFPEPENYLSNAMKFIVKTVDGKKYLTCANDDLTVINSYVVGYYILKDI